MASQSGKQTIEIHICYKKTIFLLSLKLERNEKKLFIKTFSDYRSAINDHKMYLLDHKSYLSGKIIRTKKLMEKHELIVYKCIF